MDAKGLAFCYRFKMLCNLAPAQTVGSTQPSTQQRHAGVHQHYWSAASVSAGSCGIQEHVKNIENMNRSSPTTLPPLQHRGQYPLACADLGLSRTSEHHTGLQKLLHQ